MLNLVIVFVFVFFIVYFLFFRTPVFRIEQIQITKPPSDGVMELVVKVNVWNPNVQSISLDRVNLVMTVVSTMKNQRVPYTLELKDQPIRNMTSTVCRGMSFSTVDVRSSVRLNLIAQKLVLTHEYGLRLVGRVTYTIIGVAQTDTVTKSQFVFQWS